MTFERLVRDKRFASELKLRHAAECEAAPLPAA